jgi:hypothetical protein
MSEYMNLKELVDEKSIPIAPIVINNATSTHFPEYIRIPQYISSTDERFSQGNSIENRIEPPLEELPGDIFDRQRVIDYFNQPLIESQRCLVLGIFVVFLFL